MRKLGREVSSVQLVKSSEQCCDLLTELGLALEARVRPRRQGGCEELLGRLESFRRSLRPPLRIDQCSSAALSWVSTAKDWSRD